MLLEVRKDNNERFFIHTANGLSIDRWYSGCFVWSQSAVPVFTVESEIAYLSAFTNSVTVEISRLDAVIANKIKSDFISSISRQCPNPFLGF